MCVCICVCVCVWVRTCVMWVTTSVSVSLHKEHFDYLISEDGISSIAQFLERYRSRHEIPDENGKLHSRYCTTGKFRWRVIFGNFSTGNFYLK